MVSDIDRDLIEGVQQSRAARRAAERAEKKERKKLGNNKSLLDRKIKVGSDMMKAIENITELIGVHNLEDHGSFLTDLVLFLDGQSNDNLIEQIKNVSIGKKDDAKLDISNDLRMSLTAATKPLKIALDHCKDGISFDDYSTWSKTKLLEFLRKHKLDPFPIPSHEIVLSLAEEMQLFALACMNMVESLPDDEQGAALGKQSLGCATPKDDEIVEKMYAPVKRNLTTAQAQISSNFRLDTLQKWIPGSMPKVMQTFQSLMVEWCRKQNITQKKGVLHHEVMATLECIGRVYDVMAEQPGKDVLAMLDIYKDTESEQMLAIRPLKTWIKGQYKNNGSLLPIPIIAVEWFRGKKVDGTRTIKNFTKGLKRGTLFQDIKVNSPDEFELILEILKVNRKALDVQNDVKLLEKQCTDKSWKFSVICPADLDRKDDYTTNSCYVCRKHATKNCCSVPYCSRACQIKDWSNHKKSCQKKKK